MDEATSVDVTQKEQPPPDTSKAWGGIDLGGTKIEAVVIDGAGTVLGRTRHPTPGEGSVDEVVMAMYGAIEEAAHAAGLTPQQLAGVGVGAPGAVDANAGTLAHVSNVGRGWSEPYPVAANLGELTGGRVALGNDVQVAVAAEYRLGAGRPYRSVLGVWWGTGVGGGLVLDGVPWRGRGAAGEIGHVVVKPGGARCGCGRRGCMEAYAGRASMERKARKAVGQGEKTILFELMEKKGRPRLTSSIWDKALREEDPLATWLIDRAVRMLGAGLASAINLLDVEAIVLGGGLGTRLGSRYAERIHEAMRPHIFVPGRQPPVLMAELGDQAGAIGAALLAAPPAK
ncbi:ROK family protein [Pyxidicoccus fallax]|uniref:ROK family protein n=1 Tax=Pyxidicoccus fallax TaxID=394095 RepID=A0A848LX53_9BACT|nr:ROK family protein [Pyxidicoccus fallax]NMO22625.1 ROK family protein [Pyxidicoccus fallax]NPC84719.1 ROK family protein [Pyxidicoccus fallax]